jgi:hypothetical protein
MIDSDLKRSYYQYLKHIKVGLLKLGFLQRLLLSCVFISILLFSVIASIFCYRKNKKKNSRNCLVAGNDREPYTTIKKELLKEGNIELIEVKKFTVPVLPIIFYREIFRNFCFYLKRMDFLGALSIKLVQYFSSYQKNNMKAMIVLQEYSFYMSYLTFLVENHDGKLFNIMHGIPGQEASYFRFSKCFVWGEYYKDFYLQHFAEKKQFLVSGSIYHASLLRRTDERTSKEYDIVYFMQGSRFVTKDEVADVLETLKMLSTIYKVAVKQHPLHYVPLKYNLEEIIEKDTFSILNNCKMVLSHFSTSLLDAKLLGVNVVSYSKINRRNMLSFLEEREIIDSKEGLRSYVVCCLENPSRPEPLRHEYIDTDVNALAIIKKEISLI